MSANPNKKAAALTQEGELTRQVLFNLIQKSETGKALTQVDLDALFDTARIMAKKLMAIQ